MAATDFIVAIELGSSKITGLAGKKSSDGSIQVLAYAQEDSSIFIRKGVIYNLDKTAQSLTSIINKLESKLNATIGKVYVGIGGQSLRTVGNTVLRHLDNETVISQELIDEIRTENIQIPIIDMEILEVAPQEYRIGNNLQIDPVGVLSNHIEGRFLNIVARSSVKKNIQKCFDQSRIEIAGFFISPLVTAETVLSDSEKRSGCALIDLGADTTTVSVYQKNVLRHLAVLPLGGNNITKDICSQLMEEEEAELLKVEYGCAFNEREEENEEPKVYSIDSKRSIEAKVLNNIIEARTEEILANVWNQIALSGYEDKLLAGIILTGGGANLKGIDEAMRKRIKQEKGKVDKVKIAKTRHAVKGNIAPNFAEEGTHNTLIGLLFAGEANCCKAEEAKPDPQSQPRLFEENPEDILVRKKAEEKAKKEEEERKKKEKELEKEAKKKARGSFWDGIKKKTEDLTGKLFDEENMK